MHRDFGTEVPCFDKVSPPTSIDFLIQLSDARVWIDSVITSFLLAYVF